MLCDNQCDNDVMSGPLFGPSMVNRGCTHVVQDVCVVCTACSLVDSFMYYVDYYIHTLLRGPNSHEVTL